LNATSVGIQSKVLFRVAIAGHRNDHPQRQRVQPHREDSDVEDEFEDGWNRGRHFGQRGAREFDYRQRAKDVPTFHGSINVEDFLDWMSELDTFFKFYEIPMGSRVELIAYKLKGVLNLGGKICNSFVNDKENYLSLVRREWSESYIEGFFHPIMIKFFLIFSKTVCK
ncbi:hypothetical protein Tco_1396152, partial [Tanacetum coccineum]